jgi:hypothetical protein
MAKSGITVTVREKASPQDRQELKLLAQIENERFTERHKHDNLKLYGATR